MLAVEVLEGIRNWNDETSKLIAYHLSSKSNNSKTHKKKSKIIADCRLT